MKTTSLGYSELNKLVLVKHNTQLQPRNWKVEMGKMQASRSQMSFIKIKTKGN